MFIDLQFDSVSWMTSFKTEEFYFLKPVSVVPHNYLAPKSYRGQPSTQMISPHLPFLNARPLYRQGHGSELFQDFESGSPEFYEISIKKDLSSEQLEKWVTFRCSLQQANHEKGVNDFKIRVRDLLKRGDQKDLVWEKKSVISTDASQKMEIIIIPSAYSIPVEHLEKILEHGDSKITTDSLTRFQCLPTEESIASNELNHKFRRTTSRPVFQKLDKKPRAVEVKNDFLLPKESKIQDEGPKSPSKRRAGLKRSRLIPQFASSDQTDEQHIYQQMKKDASNVFYIFGVGLQVLLMLFLMSPSSKI